MKKLLLPSIVLVFALIGCSPNSSGDKNGPGDESSSEDLIDTLNTDESSDESSDGQQNRMIPLVDGGNATDGGSLVGNGMLGNERILSVFLEGQYIGVKQNAIFNFNEKQEATSRLQGMVNVAGKPEKTELPARPQIIHNLDEDLFILIRKESVQEGVAFAADAFLIRKSDGNAWRISENQLLVHHSQDVTASEGYIRFTKDNKQSYIYFIEQINGYEEVRGFYTEKNVIALALPHNGGGITRKVLATGSSAFRISGNVGPQSMVLKNDEEQESHWISDIFGEIQFADLSLAGLKANNLIFVQDRVYSGIEGDLARLISLERKVSYSAELDSNYLAFGVHVNGFDIVGSTYGGSVIIDIASDTVVRFVDTPKHLGWFPGLKQWGDARYQFIFNSDYGACLFVPNGSKDVEIGCGVQKDLKISGDILQAEYLGGGRLTIYSNVKSLGVTTKTTLAIVDEKLVLESQVVLEAYDPATTVLVPVANLYNNL